MSSAYPKSQIFQNNNGGAKQQRWRMNVGYVLGKVAKNGSFQKNTKNDERSGFPLLRSYLPLRGSGHHY
ncbi:MULTISPECIES: hypothetical protein [unclassified Bartonella]|uniref:hypothetical protein n=1 Tax=unclassified Bartonella TaxID=2645622 RepID=UPI0035D13684